MRITGFNVVIISQWLDPAENDRNIAWARDTYAALQPYLGATRYVNYLARRRSRRSGRRRLRRRTTPGCAS